MGQGRQRWLWAGGGFHPPPVPVGVPRRRGAAASQRSGPGLAGGDSGHVSAGPVGGGWRSSGGRARGAGEGPTGAGARAAPPPSLSLPPSPPVPSSFPSPPRSSRRRPVPSRGSADSAPLRPVLPPPPHAGVPSGQQPPRPPRRSGMARLSVKEHLDGILSDFEGAATAAGPLRGAATPTRGGVPWGVDVPRGMVLGGMLLGLDVLGVMGCSPGAEHRGGLPSLPKGLGVGEVDVPRGLSVVGGCASGGDWDAPSGTQYRGGLLPPLPGTWPWRGEPDGAHPQGEPGGVRPWAEQGVWGGLQRAPGVGGVRVCAGALPVCACSDPRLRSPTPPPGGLRRGGAGSGVGLSFPYSRLSPAASLTPRREGLGPLGRGGQRNPTRGLLLPSPGRNVCTYPGHLNPATAGPPPVPATPPPRPLQSPTSPCIPPSLCLLPVTLDTV